MGSWPFTGILRSYPSSLFISQSQWGFIWNQFNCFTSIFLLSSRSHCSILIVAKWVKLSGSRKIARVFGSHWHCGTFGTCSKHCDYHHYHCWLVYCLFYLHSNNHTHSRVFALYTWHGLARPSACVHSLFGHVVDLRVWAYTRAKEIRPTTTSYTTGLSNAAPALCNLVQWWQTHLCLGCIHAWP